MTTTEQHTNCLRCGRRLTSARSRATGYGPTCRRHVRTAAQTVDLSTWKPDAVAKATELIEDGAILPLRGRIFLAVSADGAAPHRTAPTGHCTCPAGLKGEHRCYHGMAAQILSLAA
jgi:hypothetical protein